MTFEQSVSAFKYPIRQAKKARKRLLKQQNLTQTYSSNVGKRRASNETSVLKPKKMKKNGSFDEESFGSHTKNPVKKGRSKGSGASRGILGAKRTTNGVFTRKASRAGGLHNHSQAMFETYNPGMSSILDKKRGSLAS